MSKLIEDYLKGTDGKPHLRLLAVVELIATDKDVKNCFGIFVGCKRQTTSDTDFKDLEWDNTATKPGWKSSKPLWCIPLNKVNTEEKSYSFNFSGNPFQQPIDCKKAVVRFFNKYKSAQIINKWKDYIFIPDKTHTCQQLVIPCTSLIFNTGLGSFHEISHKRADVVRLSVWINDEQLSAPNYQELITLKSVPSEIIDDNKHYPNFSCFFGVGRRSNGFYPVFSSYIKENIYGGDVPIKWTEVGWVDDLLGFTINAQEFKPTLANDYSPHNDDWIAKKIFDKSIDQQTPWLGRKNDDPEKNIFLFSIDKKQLTGNLENYLSSGNSELITYLLYFYEKTREGNYEENRTIVCQITDSSNLLNSWNDKTTEQAVAIINQKGAQQVGIVPHISNLKISRLTVLYENVYGTNASFKSVQYGNGINNTAELSFPLVQNTKFKTVKKRTETLNKVSIKLNKIVFESGEKNELDNGSILITTIKAREGNASLKDNMLHDGSFSFTLDDYRADETIVDKLQISLQLRNAQRPLFLWQWYPGIDNDDYIEFCYSINKFRIPVSAVDAFGNDLIGKEKSVAPSSVGALSEGFGERSEPALVIPISKKNIDEASAKKRYYLALSESVNVSQDYRLEMQVEENELEGRVDSTVILDAIILNASPQHVAKISTDLLRSPNVDDGVYVLARKSNFSIDSGTWEIYADKALEKGFQLTLPAQGIGEAYVKGNTNNEGEPEEGKSIDYKFTPPAVLQIASEQLNRQYVTPAWNLKNIWGEVGTNPGLQLISAQFELLYGLGAQLDNKDAFISELGNKLGVIPNPPQNNIAWSPSPAQTVEFGDLYRRYRQVYRAWQSRLSILEVSASERFIPGKFDKGISYFLRKEANQLTDDKLIIEGKGAKLKWPFGKQASPEKIDKLYHSPQVEDAATGKLITEGLAGGAFYPFEALPVYEELWREGIKKGSSSGEIEELAFTSLGGYGKQTARFSNDKTTIKSTTSLGKTHFHAVERVGRIGVLWNKAKHVIEYERTVVPSPQFKGEQPPLLGRTINRKVREYIEILEPLRNYPDVGNTLLASAGSITGVQFKSIKIPVSSSWGRNVVANGSTIIGWEIPLWNKHADQEIYPLPQVLLKLLAPKSAEVKSADTNDVLSQIENIGDLYFYTDVRSEVVVPIQDQEPKIIEINAHTDNWPIIKYIDYTDVPMTDLHKGVKPALGNTPELMDAPLPAPLSILPGFERFSFIVKPLEITSSVNGRYVAGSEINGKLRVVTMMRSASKGNSLLPRLNVDAGSPQLALANIINTLAFDTGNILNQCTNGFSSTNTDLLSGIIPENINIYVEEITVKIDALHNHIGNIQGQLFATRQLTYLTDASYWTVANTFELPTKLLWKKVIEQADEFIANVVSNYNLLTTEVTKKLDEQIAAQNQITRQFIAQLKTTVDNNLDAVKKIIEQFSFELTSYSNGAIELLNTGDSVLNYHLNYIDGQLAQARENIKKVDQNLSSDAAKQKINDLITTGKASIFQQIDTNALLKKVDDKFKLKDKIEALVKSVKGEITASNTADINALIAFAQQKCATLKTAIFSAINELQDVSSVIKDAINSQAASLKQDIQEIENALKQLLQHASQQITQNSEAFKNELDTLSEEKEAFITEFRSLWVELLNVTIKHELIESILECFSIILINSAPPSQPLVTYFKIADDYIKGIIAGLSSFFRSLENGIDPDKYKAEYQKYLSHYQSYKNLETAFTNGNVKEILVASNQFAEEINQDLGDFTGSLLATYTEVSKTTTTYNELDDAVNNTLFNYRSVYDELVAPGLGFNRKTVAMLVNTDWKMVEQRLTITPVISKFNQLTEKLSALGVRLPSVSITDKFLAPAKEWGDSLKNFKESMLSNYDFTNVVGGAGINWERCIPGFKMPDEFRDNIEITNGFDKENLKAWAQAKTNVSLSESKQLFAIGPVQVSLDKSATLKGKVRAEIDPDSSVTKDNTGELKGSFVIALQQTELMRFRDVTVSCINDKYSFDLDPSRMEMSGLLKLITDATKNIPTESSDKESDSAFQVKVLKAPYKKTGVEVPYGINASLDIPPITVGGGPTNMTNLAFGGNFRLKAFDVERAALDFSIGLGFYLGKREAPFIFTAFIFGGGGFIDCNLDYTPAKANSLSVSFAMSVQASAALAFNVGWLCGSVMIGLGVEVVYVKQFNGPGSSNSVIMFVQFIGHVCVVRIIHVFVVVRLAIAYDGSKMKGTGRIKASMRICRFFTLKVEKDYTHNF